MKSSTKVGKRNAFNLKDQSFGWKPLAMAAEADLERKESPSILIYLLFLVTVSHDLSADGKSFWHLLVDVPLSFNRQGCLNPGDKLLVSQATWWVLYGPSFAFIKKNGSLFEMV